MAKSGGFVTMALSKGRILEDTLPFLRGMGIELIDDPEKSRKLIVETSDPKLRIIIVRASDVPTYVQEVLRIWELLVKMCLLKTIVRAYLSL